MFDSIFLNHILFCENIIKIEESAIANPSPIIRYLKDLFLQSINYLKDYLELLLNSLDKHFKFFDF